MGKHTDTFEAWLRSNNIPYISVDEAKKALPGHAKLRSFHFVVYGDGGNLPNLLTFVCDRPTQEIRRDMEQWREVFGEGFAAAFVKMKGGRPAFRWLDGESFAWPCAETTPVDGLAAIVTEFKRTGDEIPLIEHLNENHELYAEVEDAMADAGSGGDAVTEKRLSDWLDAYRLALIEGRPLPNSPLEAEPNPTPQEVKPDAPTGFDKRIAAPESKDAAANGTPAETHPRIAAIRERIDAMLKRAAEINPGVSLRNKQEGCRLKINQIEFLLEGFPENFRQAVRSTLFLEVNEALDLVWEHLRDTPCPDTKRRTQAGRRYGKAGALAQPRVYEPFMAQHGGSPRNKPVESQT